MKLRNSQRRFQNGDLVMIEGLEETGIVIEPNYMGDAGHDRIGVMLSEEDGVVVKLMASRCHLISRSIGSPCQSTPFPDELLIEKGPNVEKFSSESFQELSTLTIDEDVQ